MEFNRECRYDKNNGTQKRWNIIRDEKWYYNGVEIEIVNQLNYLGVVFTSGGSFIQATKPLSGKTLMALCALLSLTKFPLE